MAPVKLAANHINVIGWNVTMLFVKALALANRIGKQRFDLAPVSFGAANMRRAIDDICLSLESLLNHRYIQLMMHQHGGKALVVRQSRKRNTLGWSKAGCAPMAKFLGPLHEPVHLVLRYAEVVFQDPSRPDGGGLLVL